MSQAKDLPRFEYRCSAGHVIGADHPIPSCPAYVLGSPCTGTLTRFGQGSRLAKSNPT